MRHPSISLSTGDLPASINQSINPSTNPSILSGPVPTTEDRPASLPYRLILFSTLSPSTVFHTTNITQSSSVHLQNALFFGSSQICMIQFYPQYQSNNPQKQLHIVMLCQVREVA
ncbi:hypothetical protein ACMFMG_009948 [Clarireedia jacksonii]